MLRAELREPITNHQPSIPRDKTSFWISRLFITLRFDISFRGSRLGLTDCITCSAYHNFWSTSAKDQSQITKCHMSHSEGRSLNLYTLWSNTSAPWYIELWVAKGHRLSSEYFPRFTHRSLRAKGRDHLDYHGALSLYQGSKPSFKSETHNYLRGSNTEMPFLYLDSKSMRIVDLIRLMVTNSVEI